MPNYHIEGISGTGKTTVGKELERRGHKVVHADDAFGYYSDPKTGLPTKDEQQLNWIWDRAKARKELLQTAGDEAKFVCGGSMNQDEFADCFTNAFVLYLDDATLKDRLLNRTNNNFGKNPEDLERQLEWNKNSELPLKYAKEKGAIPIDASKPVEEVVNEILSHVKTDK